MNLIIILTFTLFWAFLCSHFAKKYGFNTTVWFAVGILCGLLGFLALLLIKKYKLAKNDPSKIKNDTSEILDLPSCDKMWFYLDTEENQIGPMSIQKLSEEYSNQKITKQNYVWNEDLKDWEKLERILSTVSKVPSK